MIKRKALAESPMETLVSVKIAQLLLAVCAYRVPKAKKMRFNRKTVSITSLFPFL